MLACEDILLAYRLVEMHQQIINGLQSKQCPNCSEPNKPDSEFCTKCRMVLTYDAYNETIEENQDKEVQNLKEQMLSMQAAQKDILDLLKDPAKLLGIIK